MVIVLLTLSTIAGGVLRIREAPTRYPAHEHQQRDVHRYYVSPAESLLAGRGWETDYRQNFIPPPLQGVFVLLVRFVHPEASYGTMRTVQAWIASATILLAFAVGLQLGGAWVGAVSAVFIAFDPDVIDYVSILLAENNYFFLLFGYLAVQLLALRKANTVLMAASGVLLGFTSLMKPFPSLLALAIPAYLALRYRTRTSLRWGLVFVLGFAVVLAPWIARNQQRFGSFTGISTNGGTALAISNFPGLDATQDVYFEPVMKQGLWRDQEIEVRFRGRRDRDGRHMWNERDRAYSARTIQYAMAEPFSFARNYVVKVYNVFRYSPETRKRQWIAGRPYRVAMIVLGLPGLIWFTVAERRRPRVVMSWIFAYYAAVQGIFYISTTGRIQLPTKLLLSFFAAYLAVNAVKVLRARLAR